MNISDVTFDHTCRLIARAPKTAPISVVEGSSPPELIGDSFFFTTLSGLTVVRYPSAYGYPTLYHPSTLRVEVGKNWKAPIFRSARIDGVLTHIVCRSRITLHGIQVETAYTGGEKIALIKLPNGNYHHVSTATSTRTVIRIAINREKKQNAQQKKWAAGLSLPLDRISVSYIDAINAGNCSEGIISFCRRHNLSPNCEISADMLLRASGSDSLDRVRATISSAATRQI